MWSLRRRSVASRSRFTYSNNKTLDTARHHHPVRLLESILLSRTRRIHSQYSKSQSSIRHRRRNSHQQHWKPLERFEKNTPKIRNIKTALQFILRRVLHSKKFIDSSTDKFLEVLRLISLVYNQTRAKETPTAQHDELHTRRKDTTLTSAASPTPTAIDNNTVLPARDIGNSDLQFTIGDVDSEVDMFD